MKQQTFKTVDDILKHYGWGGEIRFVEVKKDEGNANRTDDIPTVSEDSKGERDIKQQSATSVPEKLRKGS